MVIDGPFLVKLIAPQSIADIFIYIIFILSLIMLALIPDKNQLPTYLMTAVIFLCMIDKLRQQAMAQIPIQGLENDGFATLLIHIMLFVFPMMSAGLIRGTGKKDKRGVPVGILIALISGLYAVGSFLLISTFYGAA